MKQAKQVIPVRQTFAVRGILFLGVLLLVFLVMHPREGFASAKEGMTLMAEHSASHTSAFYDPHRYPDPYRRNRKTSDPAGTACSVFCWEWMSTEGMFSCLACSADIRWVPNSLQICMKQVRSAAQRLIISPLSVITPVRLL